MTAGVTIEEARAAARIHPTVTDAQADTLIRLRTVLEIPSAVYSGCERQDGTRAVIPGEAMQMIANIDAEGYAVAVNDQHRWERTPAPFDPGELHPSWLDKGTASRVEQDLAAAVPEAPA